MAADGFEALLGQSLSEYERSRRTFRRATVLLGVMLLGLVGAFVLGPLARSAGRADLVVVNRIMAWSELIAIIGLCLFFRQALARQIRAAAEHHRTVASQNERLVQQNAELTNQAELLQHQATELEAQTEALGGAERAQRSLAEQALLLSRRLAEAQHVAQLGYWEIDSATGDVFWSDEMYRLAGLPVGERPVPTEQFIARVHPDDRERMQAVAAAAVANLTEFTEQYRIVIPQGPTRFVQAKGRIITDELGARKLIGTVQDISERVDLESRLRHIQKLDAIGQLAGGLAHDFNNLLTVIDGCVGLLAADPNDPDRDEFLTEIRDAARRGSAMTRQLLAFSRQQVVQPRVFDLNDTVRGLNPMLRRLIDERIKLVTKLDAVDARIRADPGQIEQVLLNLLVNARDAMPAGGTLRVETTNLTLDETYCALYPAAHPGAHVVLVVSDSGVGMPHDMVDRIFEPFFTTKPAGKGTGLGLATVHGIVQQSGGHISVYSEPGQGSTFRLYFPAQAASEDGEESRAAATPAPKGSETILLVEDDRSVRITASAVLRRAGYQVAEAMDGSEALVICRDPQQHFDLVLSDVVMPNMGGRELATALRSESPSLPIILMSGYTRDASILSGDPTLAFLEKPFTSESLTQRVRDVLDAARSAGPA